MLGVKSQSYRCHPGTWSALQTWYSTSLGQALEEIELQQMDQVLANLFGYHLLQVGRPSNADLLRASRVSHCTVMGATPDPGESQRASTSNFCAEPHNLPVASTSLDIVVLPHVLEFSEQPHAVLREVERCLIPEGNLVLTGFNPWSLWLAPGLLLGWRRRVPWCGRFRSMTRIRDWLALLGFDVEMVRTYFFRPPWQHAGLLGRLHFMEAWGRRIWPPFGGGYLMVAKKRVVTVTPVRPRWRPRRRKLVAPGLVEPYQRRHTPPPSTKEFEING